MSLAWIGLLSGATAGGLLGHLFRGRGSARIGGANVLVGSVICAVIGMLIATGVGGQAPAAGGQSIPRINSAQDFTDKVLGEEGVVVAYFSSATCPPCRLTEPVLIALRGEYAGKARFVKLDAGEVPSLFGDWDVKAVPTVIVFAGGKERDRLVGARQASEYRRAIDAQLKKKATYKYERSWYGDSDIGRQSP